MPSSSPSVALSRLWPAIAVIAALMWSCADDERAYRAGRINPESTPTMTTLRANTTISDSGFMRYRILAPEWLMYDNASDPHWRFPKGMHMERYDNKGNINATIDCDSATYFTSRQTWRLDGAVDIASTDGQRFLTEQLWWDRLRHEVYSDSFIHIERADRVIEGFGFRSNDQMTNYVVTSTSGIFPASQFKPGAADDDEPMPVFSPQTSSVAYDPVAAAADDPADAQRTEESFNGTPSDTIYVTTSGTNRPGRRAARDVLRRRRPTAAPPAPLTPMSR